MATQTPSLVDFATTARLTGGAGCKTCALDEALRTQVEDYSVSADLGAKWLKTVHGIALSSASIKRHRENHLDAV